MPTFQHKVVIIKVTVKSGTKRSIANKGQLLSLKNRSNSTIRWRDIKDTKIHTKGPNKRTVDSILHKDFLRVYQNDIKLFS